jgi:hypothetical protein
MCERPSVSSEEFPKARKKHKCCECHREIAIGEKYQLVKGCWDGEWSKYKTCLPCYELRNKINSDMRGLDDPLCFEGLQETAQEYEYQWPPTIE